MNNAPDDDFPPVYYPTLLQLGLTYRCNLKCPHCYALHHRTRTELTTDEVRKLIDDAWDLGSCKVVYSHGENLIRQDFHEIARYIAEKGFYQTLMTNGYYLRKDAQVESLARCGVNKVMVSIDSSREHEHNQNRGQDNAFEIAVDSIRRLRERREFRLGISMAIDTRNYDRVREVVQMGEEFGVDFISLMQVRPNLPHTFAAYDWSRYERLSHDLYELILEYRGRIDVYTHDPFMLTLMDDRLDPDGREDFIAHNQCNVGKYMMSICPDGEVTGCNFIERVVGNVRDEPLAVIWGRLMHDYADDNWNEGPCSGCPSRGPCGTGCKAFHLPFESRYDRRCESNRFGEWSTNGKSDKRLKLVSLPILKR